MAASSKKLSTRLRLDAVLSGDATTPKDLKWVDMRDYGTLIVLVMAAALTGAGVTVFKLLGNTAADGSGTDVEIKAHAVGSAPNAAGDYLILECTAEEVAACGAGYRFVSAQIDAANAADNIAAFYVRGDPRFAIADLSADYVS